MGKDIGGLVARGKASTGPLMLHFIQSAASGSEDALSDRNSRTDIRL